MLTTESVEIPQNCGVVRNIPFAFHSSDLRNFFSDFVEREKFKCFHFKHRPEVAKVQITGDNKTKNRTCCAVFQSTNEEDMSEFIRIYNETNWIDERGNCLKNRCIIHRIKVSMPNHASKKNIASSAHNNTPQYTTRGEDGHKKRHAVTEEFSSSDLLSLSEFRPPTHIMPRGNVGTTIKEFTKLINSCKLPPKVIKKLGLKFPKTGSNRRYGNVPFQYLDTSEKTSSFSNAYTANGNEVGESSQHEALNSNQNEFHDDTQSTLPSQTSDDEASGPDDDDDTCEEWERHEALHSDVTSQERSKERLFEEEIELKWEKGGSGLVFYTDAQFWQEEEGDFDEQTTDDWDVDMSIYYGGSGDMDARQYLQMRKEKRATNALYDDSLDERLWPEKRPKSGRARSESPPGPKRRGAFERHTKGVGRRLLESKGWKEGDPLGPQSSSAGITDPVEVDGQHPRLRKGLGYHGAKLLSDNDNSWKDTNHGRKTKLVLTKTFRNVRSVEPMASHSYMFPQFDFNLGNEFRTRTKNERRKATPGDDGIVITTKYDEPLDIDRREGLMRSNHPAGLKRRVALEEAPSHGVEQPEERGLGVSQGSKLVRTGQHVAQYAAPAHGRRRPRNPATTCANVPFVSGGLLKDA